jgi:hypothetical protein
MIKEIKENIFHLPSEKNENSLPYNETNYNQEADFTAFNILISGILFIGLYNCIRKIKPKITNYIKTIRYKSALQNYLELHETSELNHLDQECSICLDGFISQENIVKLDCQHSFHSTCIKEWLKKELICPNCRSPLEL